MTLSFFQLAISLIIILIASEIFTNALEHLGERLKISEGVTGSLFAAIGTALPETMVPIWPWLPARRPLMLTKRLAWGDIGRAADVVYAVGLFDGAGRG